MANRGNLPKGSLTSEADLKAAAVKRSLFSNKYENGRLLIIGGSSSYYGAPVLALDSAYQSLTALRIGVGYVKAFVPRSILATARSLSPNTIINALGEERIEFNQQIKKEIEKADSVLIGMGIGANSEAAARKIIECSLKNKKKTIVDAEAIMALKKLKGKTDPQNLMITPHDHEFSRLTGIQVSPKDINQRISASILAARKLKSTIVLKGHYTIITDGSRLKINKAKTPALATMGTGDVLAGMIAGYSTLNGNLFKSAVASVYLHSKIGDALFRGKGNHAIAYDIISKIPRILRKYD